MSLYYEEFQQKCIQEVVSLFPGRKLSGRLINTLSASGIRSFEQIEVMDNKDFLDLPNFGRKALKELEEHLRVVYHHDIPVRVHEPKNKYSPFKNRKHMIVSVFEVAIESGKFKPEFLQVLKDRLRIIQAGSNGID